MSFLGYFFSKPRYRSSSPTVAASLEAVDETQTALPTTYGFGFL